MDHTCAILPSRLPVRHRLFQLYFWHLCSFHQFDQELKRSLPIALSYWLTDSKAVDTTGTRGSTISNVLNKMQMQVDSDSPV